jgi:hypothetical protein
MKKNESGKMSREKFGKEFPKRIFFFGEFFFLFRNKKENKKNGILFLKL